MVLSPECSPRFSGPVVRRAGGGTPRLGPGKAKSREVSSHRILMSGHHLFFPVFIYICVYIDV